MRQIGQKDFTERDPANQLEFHSKSNLSPGERVKAIQVQGVHHITIVGSTRQSAVDFWQGVLGMPFLFEQPNLGRPEENHLYFDPGDGRLLTVFTDETRQDAGRHAPREIGCVEHLAFNVSRATFILARARLRERGIEFIERDRGFMDSIYLRDPNGLKVELACYKFEPPKGFRAADVLSKAHSLRVERGDHHITEEHLADAIEFLLATRRSLPVSDRAVSSPGSSENVALISAVLLAVVTVIAF
jgi:catechol 2,3-dioxygenase-like lactoylglutathione lyase family enzyme